MTFLNARLLGYAAIALIATVLMHLVAWNAGTPPPLLILSVIAYIATIVLGCVLISRKDPYQYFGFNYHFITYVICLAVPLALHALSLIPEPVYLRSMALNWGFGLLIHFIVFVILARKRRLKGYDKGEIFQ